MTTPETILDLTVERLGGEGQAIAHHEGKVILVEGGIPGEQVRVRVQKSKKRYAKAVITEILAKGDLRRDPPCSYFGTCGGCQWQHLDYAAQLAWKRQQVEDCFTHPVAIAYGELRNPVAAPRPYHYRNKMEFSFGERRWLTAAEIASDTDFTDAPALGLHVPGRYDRVLDIDHCLLQTPGANHILREMRQLFERYRPSIYQTRTHSGFLRHFVLRTAQHSSDSSAAQASEESMVILVTSPPQSATDEALLHHLPEAFPLATTVLHASTISKAQVASGSLTTLRGNGYITEWLRGVQFRISPFSFFQTNPSQAARLVDVVIEAVQPQPHQILWDLYCGTGTLGLSLAAHVRQVIGIEIVASAIEDARLNAALNGLHQVQFWQQDMSQPTDLWAQLPSPDVVVVDPPRAGLDAETVQRLLRLAPPRLVYVSCNPATQARDCALLAAGFEIQSLQPVDMFPQTSHVENVATLVHRSPRLTGYP
ncbi:MAG: 23S rRNA (uracil(1939)-C(5))-methyltransferase RlmD [Synechococcales cyanobacterium]